MTLESLRKNLKNSRLGWGLTLFLGGSALFNYGCGALSPLSTWRTKPLLQSELKKADEVVAVNLARLKKDEITALRAMRTLAEWYGYNINPKLKKQIEEVAYEFLEQRKDKISYNIGFGLWGPNGERVNAGVTKYDNPEFELKKVSWEKVKEYVSPRTIVGLAGKVQDRYTDTYGSPQQFQQVREYLRGKGSEPLEKTVYNLLDQKGKDTLLEGRFRAGDFFDGSRANYEIRNVSLQAHYN